MSAITVYYQVQRKRRGDYINIPSHLNGHKLTTPQRLIIAILEKNPQALGCGHWARLVRVKKTHGVYLHLREGRYLSHFSVSPIGHVLRVPYDQRPKQWEVLHNYEDKPKDPGPVLDNVPKADPEKVTAFEERQEARKERLQERADKHAQEATRRLDAAHDAVKHIPPGQPILVGHHSERGHRAALKRHDGHMNKFCEHYETSKRLQERVDNFDRNQKRQIRSDDPQALEKLAAKIKRLEEWQELMKRANEVIRQKDLSDEKKVERLLEMGIKASEIRHASSMNGKKLVGFSYRLKNNNANIRRLKGRYTTLLEERGRDTDEEAVGAVTIRENEEYHSVEISFPGKPSEEVRAEMKRYGWRWARVSKVWYRKGRNDTNREQARQFAQMYTGVTV